MDRGLKWSLGRDCSQREITGHKYSKTKGLLRHMRSSGTAMCPNSYLTIHEHARKGCTALVQGLHEENPIPFNAAAFRNTDGLFSQGQPKEASVPTEMFP